MKKTLIFILSIITSCGIMFCGCSFVGNSADSETASVQSGAKFSGIPLDFDTQGEILQLVEGDRKCFFEIFGLERLPVDPKKVIDERYYYVDSNQYESFIAFEKYVRSIYCNAEAERLLFGITDQGVYTPQYVEIDGELYFDSDTSHGMGYYSTWPDYSIEIVDLTDDICEFILHTTDDPPPVDGDPAPLALGFKALKEDGQWKLEKMVY